MGNTFWFSISLLVTRLVLAVHPYVIQANGPEWVPVPVLERNEAKLSDNASFMDGSNRKPDENSKPTQRF